MIPGLYSYATDGHLAAPADLAGATIGVNAELLAGLSSAEIVARLAPHGPKTSETDVHFIVVFDGPGRTTPSKLDDGLLRRRVMRVVAESGVPFLVAPCLAAAQLAKMYTNGHVSHVAGADEALLWGDVPLVIDCFSDTRLVLRRGRLLAALRVSEPAFVELVLGLGRNVVVVPPLPLLGADPVSLDDAGRVAFQFGGPAPPPPPGTTLRAPNVSVLRAAQLACSPTYVHELQRALAFVQRQPVLNADGAVELSNLSQHMIPRDLPDVVGRQLAPETLWYLNKGIVGPELLRSMMWGTFEDSFSAPRTPESAYKAFVAVQRGVSAIRQQAYALLTSPAHRYFQMKEVVNKTSGGTNFVRTSPVLPSISGSSVSDIVDAAVNHVREFAKLDGDSGPEELVRRAVGSKEVDAILVNIATLALRELAESVVCWFMATGKVPREHTLEIMLGLPWSERKLANGER